MWGIFLVHIMRYSGNVRKNLEYLGIKFNEEAVVILTSHNVPIHVKVVASLGKTFNFYQEIDGSTKIEVFVCMNKIVSECDNCYDWFNVNHEFINTRRQMSDGTLNQYKPTEAQYYISELMFPS